MTTLAALTCLCLVLISYTLGFILGRHSSRDSRP